MSMYKKFIFCFIMLTILIVVPSNIASAKDNEEYRGEVSHDDTKWEELTDEELESYQPKDCNNYELVLDSTYKIHVVIKHDNTAEEQEGYLNLSFGYDEMSKGFFENIHISSNEGANNEFDITLEAGTYQMQVSLAENSVEKINYVLLLTYTKSNDSQDKKHDKAKIAFIDELYSLEVKNKEVYDDAQYDFYEEVDIESNLKYKATEIMWKSSDKKIATVDKEGTITIHSPGSFILTASLPNGKEDDCIIIVPEPKYKINKKEVTIYKGKSVTLKVTADPVNQNKNIKWTSSNNKIATVSKDGKVKGIKKGTCTITAKLPFGQVTCKVTIMEKTPVIDVADYLKNPTALAKKQNDSFEFQSKNGRVTYAYITGEDATFHGLNPGEVNMASLLLPDYKLIDSETVFMGTISYYKKRSTGEMICITETLLLISSIEYYIE